MGEAAAEVTGAREGRGQRRQKGRGAPNPLLQYAAICGLVAMALTLWVGGSGAPLPGDVWLARRVQEAPGMGDLARGVNAAGDWPWQFAVVTVSATAIWFHRERRRRRKEALLALAAALALLLWDQLLKAIVRSPRPAADFGIRVDYLRDSYGFPSGHVYSDVVVYGTIAVLAASFLPKWWAMALRAAVLALLVLAGPARVYVGAHWPSDVIGGYLWGAAALLMAVAFGRWAAKRA